MNRKTYLLERSMTAMYHRNESLYLDALQSVDVSLKINPIIVTDRISFLLRLFYCCLYGSIEMSKRAYTFASIVYSKRLVYNEMHVEVEYRLIEKHFTYDIDVQNLFSSHQFVG